MIFACSTQPHVLKQTEISFQEAYRIYVVRTGLHTGIVLPASTVQSQLPQVYDSLAGSPYIEFGWGDQTYYQSEKVTSGMTVKAIFWPTNTVIKVTAIPESPDSHFVDHELEVLCLAPEQYSLLMAFVVDSFLKDSDGQVIESVDSSIDSNGSQIQFYKARGDYYLFNTCNTWTAKGLKSAGLDISPAFKLTPGSVMGYLSKHEINGVGSNLSFPCGLRKTEK